MSYTFNNLMEFKNFVEESLDRGYYAQEIENLAIGVNTISNEERKWDFVEVGKLYLVKSVVTNPSLGSSLYFIYRHPGERFEDYIWYYYPKDDKGAPVSCNTWEYNRGSMAWVEEYLVIGSHPYSLSFMNWINEDPFEIK